MYNAYLLENGIVVNYIVVGENYHVPDNFQLLPHTENEPHCPIGENYADFIASINDSALSGSENGDTPTA